MVKGVPVEEFVLIYQDERGREKTLIRNDGSLMKMTLRGVEFEGSDFDSFEVAKSDTTYSPEMLSQFSFSRGELWDCVFIADIPILITKNETEESKATLQLTTHLEKPTCWSSSALILTDGHRISPTKTCLEVALEEIIRMLPDSTRLKCCFNCAFSDYHPCGNGEFGCLMCFRNEKDAYRKVTGKEGIFDLDNRFEEFVQETSWCSEFELRIPGTGYRG